MALSRYFFDIKSGELDMDIGLYVLPALFLVIAIIGYFVLREIGKKVN